MPLAMVKAGSRVRLVSVNGGEGLQGRLAAMGLISGAEISVVQNSVNGPFIVSILKNRIVLGRGVAQAIIVS